MTATAADHTVPRLTEGARLTVDGFTLTVRTGARRKRFALTVEQDASLTLHAPEGGQVADAEGFVRAHRSWLAAKTALRGRTRPLSPPKRLIEGEVFRYLGRTYRLSVSVHQRSDAPARLVAGRLVVSPAQATDPAAGRAALVAWYSQAGRNWAARRLQPWASRMGVDEPDLDVGDLGGRWGVYRPTGVDHPAGQMRLGWPLFQLPMHLVDYVVAHELAHIRVTGHGADFWRLLGTALPEFARRRAELGELGRRMWMGDIAQ